jgi:hypothetical protein
LCRTPGAFGYKRLERIEVPARAPNRTVPVARKLTVGCDAQVFLGIRIWRLIR